MLQRVSSELTAANASGDECASVLVAGDSAEVRETLVASLGRHSFDVRTAHSYRELLDEIQRHAPDSVVVTGSIQGGSAFDMLRALRPGRELPWIVVIADDYDEIEHVVALELGADDYLRRDVSPQLIAARLRASLRRGSVAAESGSRTALQFGSLTIDRLQRKIHRDGAAVPLTGGEFDVLWLLASQAGRVVERRQLLQLTRGSDDLGDDRSISSRIYRIRVKLGDSRSGPQRIKAVRSLGYLFSPFGW